MTDIKLLELTEKVYRTYRQTVKGAENESYDQIQRKLTRNMLLAHKVEDKEGYEGKEMFWYGRLWFVVKNGNKVIWLKNYCGNPPSTWKLDCKRYVQLNKELGINDDSTYTEVKLKKIKNGIMSKVRRIKLKLNKGGYHNEVKGN